MLRKFSAGIALFVLCLSLAANSLASMRADEPGFEGVDSSQREDVPAILVIHKEKPWAYFGFQLTNHVPLASWELFKWTVTWAAPNLPINGADVLVLGGDPIGYAIRDFLENEWFGSIDVDVNSIHWLEDYSVPELQQFDLIIYAHSYGLEFWNVRASGIPFITVSAHHAWIMDMARDDTSTQEFRHGFCIVNYGPYPIFDTELGYINLGANTWTWGFSIGQKGKCLIAKSCDFTAVESHTWSRLKSMYR